MSKRLDVLQAVKALAAGALAIPVIGLDGDEGFASRVPDAGRAIMRAGDAGEASIDLSPVYYWYEHPIPFELQAASTSGVTAEEMIDASLMAIGAAIEADRTLGGLCIWLEATAPRTFDIQPTYEIGGRDVTAARPPRGAEFSIVAHYGTPNPLT